VACSIIACDADCNAIDLQAKHPKNNGVARLMIGRADSIFGCHSYYSLQLHCKM
jgi:hypothetical protein